MSEKPLLLPSAKAEAHIDGRYWRFAAMAIGLFVVLIGAADVTTRLAHAAFGNNASLYSFAPAITLLGGYNSDAGVIATSTAHIASTTPLIPVRLQIPSIGVNAKVEQVGKKDDGSMGTPTTFNDVGWYAPGSAPGQAGNAVIDGHVNNALTTAGVFQHLSQIVLGDTITVLNASGTKMDFVVTNVEEVAADTAPAASIFATTGPSQLVLITCDGAWVQSAKSFDKRLVVFASLK
jgi:LPXTG-site transpeptidase (sortase) family protein